LTALLISLFTLAATIAVQRADIRSLFTPDFTCHSHPGAIKLRPASAVGSSTLRPQDHVDGSKFFYSAEHAIDGQVDTAWIPAGTDGGEGQHITVAFGESVHIMVVCVVNGYAYSTDTYETNAKIRDVSVTTLEGTAQGTLMNLPSDR
jgi:hypothetical protein